MRRVRLVLLLLLAGLGLAGYLALRAWGMLEAAPAARAVPRGDQEIAWINPATSGSNWERFVAGIRRVARERPELIVLDRNAFPEQTAAVPEIGVQWPNGSGRLWFRWYKMTSALGTARWVQELGRRDPAPLAIIGGGTSDRGRDLAEAMADAEQTWPYGRPLLLLTTATADQVYLERQNLDRPLTQIYPERTFRFCFTNRQMAEAVRDFIGDQDYLRPPDKDVAVLAATAASGLGSWPGLGLLAVRLASDPPGVFALDWADDPYSVDLAKQFTEALKHADYEVRQPQKFRVRFSVGGYSSPNPSEAYIVRRFLVPPIAAAPGQRQLLILPAMDRPARRILRALSTALPDEVRHVLAITGDSIAFNTVYRDRDLAWDVQDMPVPLVFFCHQNPVAWSPENAPAPRYGSSTDEELLNADIVRFLVEEAFAAVPGPTSPAQRLRSSADELASQLHRREPAFFEADGNRLGGSGEYVVCLRPHFEGDQVLPFATIEVWTRRADRLAASRWRLVRPPLRIDYTEPAGGGGTHGGF